MRSTATALVHRAKRARSVIVRIQATWAGTQLLLSVWPLTALVALVLWLRHRRTRGEHPPADDAQPAAAEAGGAPS